MMSALQLEQRLGLLTARQATDGGLHLLSLMLEPSAGTVELWETPLPEGAVSYPSLTPKIPQAHWFERAVHGSETPTEPS